MKYSLRVELEAGDEIMFYDVLKHRGPATVLTAGSYREDDDCQRLVVQAGKEKFEFDGRIEDKAGALGYDRIPVFAVWVY